MQKESSKQMTKEIQFSLEAVNVRKVSLEGDVNSFNLYADRVAITSWQEPPEPQTHSKMIPFSSNTRGNEPNSFHF